MNIRPKPKTPGKLVEDFDAFTYKLETQPDPNPKEIFQSPERETKMAEIKALIGDLRVMQQAAESFLSLNEGKPRQEDSSEFLSDVILEAEETINKLMLVLQRVYDMLEEINQSVDQAVIDKNREKELDLDQETRRRVESTTGTPAGDGLPHGPKGGRVGGGRGLKYLR